MPVDTIQSLPRLAYTIDEAAAILGATRKAITRYIASGKLKATQPTGHKGRWLIPASSLDKLLGV